MSTSSSLSDAVPMVACPQCGAPAGPAHRLPVRCAGCGSVVSRRHGLALAIIASALLLAVGLLLTATAGPAEPVAMKLASIRRVTTRLLAAGVIGLTVSLLWWRRVGSYRARRERR